MKCMKSAMISFPCLLEESVEFGMPVKIRAKRPSTRRPCDLYGSGAKGLWRTSTVRQYGVLEASVWVHETRKACPLRDLRLFTGLWPLLQWETVVILRWFPETWGGNLRKPHGPIFGVFQRFCAENCIKKKWNRFAIAIHFYGLAPWAVLLGRQPTKA